MSKRVEPPDNVVDLASAAVVLEAGAPKHMTLLRSRADDDQAPKRMTMLRLISNTASTSGATETEEPS